MKKLIAIICVLLVIFVGMVIYRRSNINSNNVTASEVGQIEEYITKIYAWKEVTGEALPTFDDINNAPDLWLWQVVVNNLEEYAVSREQIQSKATEIFGANFTKEFPEEGTENLKYDESLNLYVAEEIQTDNKEDVFYINSIEKSQNEYKVEIAEYLEDYSNETNETEESNNGYDIKIENLNGEEIATVKDTDGETVIVNTIKENIDKLSKKIVTLQKGDNDNFYVTKVVNRDVDF